MFPSFPHYKEGTGGRGQIEPGPPVIEVIFCPLICDFAIKVSGNLAKFISELVPICCVRTIFGEKQKGTKWQTKNRKILKYLPMTKVCFK
jgi:hypothetical protein